MPKKLFFALISMVVLLSACSSSGTSNSFQEDEAIEIKVGIISFASYAPLFFAEAEGFYEEQGLNVTLVPFDRGTEALVALIQGDIDVSANNIDIATLNAILEGVNLKYVADKGFLDANGCTFSSWMASNEVLASGQLEDLNNITELNIVYRTGNVLIDYAMDVMLEPVGLTSEDLNITNVPFPNREEAFRNGAIDIAQMGEPWITRMLDAGVAQNWAAMENYLPDAQFAVLWYGPTITEENREAGKRFMVAYLKAVRQYNEGKTDRNVELMAEFTGLDADLVRQSCWQAFNADGSINFQTIQDLQEWAIAKDILEEFVPVEDYWDGEFIGYANEALD